MALIGLCRVTSNALVQTVLQAYSPGRVSPPDHGHISYDSGRAGCRGDAGRALATSFEACWAAASIVA